jgi:hypothetical protein
MKQSSPTLFAITDAKDTEAESTVPFTAYVAMGLMPSICLFQCRVLIPK